MKPARMTMTFEVTIFMFPTREAWNTSWCAEFIYQTAK